MFCSRTQPSIIGLPLIATGSYYVLLKDTTQHYWVLSPRSVDSESYAPGLGHHGCLRVQMRRIITICCLLSEQNINNTTCYILCFRIQTAQRQTEHKLSKSDNKTSKLTYKHGHSVSTIQTEEGFNINKKSTKHCNSYYPQVCLKPYDLV